MSRVVTEAMVDAALVVLYGGYWADYLTVHEQRGRRETVCEALEAALSVPERQTAWVIENTLPNQPEYFCGGKAGRSFSPDHMQAIRFIRREDAAACADFFPISQAIHAEAREHVWLAASSPASTPDLPDDIMALDAAVHRLVDAENDEIILRDEGADFVLDALAKALGVTQWTQHDGSETWDGDVRATLMHLLRDAGVLDPETDAPLYTTSAKAEQKAEPVARKRFPILKGDGATIDWQLVEDHGGQAQQNHYQTVQRLAERGGLSWSELHAVLHNQRYRDMDANEAMLACRALEAKYLAAIAPDPQAIEARNAVIEECAKIADTILEGQPIEFGWHDGARYASREIAAAIRALRAAEPRP